MVRDAIDSLLRIVPAAGLKGNHFGDGIELREILQIDTDLGTRISRILIEIIQFLITACHGC